MDDHHWTSCSPAGVVACGRGGGVGGGGSAAGAARQQLHRTSPSAPRLLFVHVWTALAASEPFRRRQAAAGRNYSSTWLILQFSQTRRPQLAAAAEAKLPWHADESISGHRNQTVNGEERCRGMWPGRRGTHRNTTWRKCSTIFLAVLAYIFHHQILPPQVHILSDGGQRTKDHYQGHRGSRKSSHKNIKWHVTAAVSGGSNNWLRELSRHREQQLEDPRHSSIPSPPADPLGCWRLLLSPTMDPSLPFTPSSFVSGFHVM